MEPVEINVLGTKYEIIVKKYSEEEAFKRHCIKGFCDSYRKQIVVCSHATFEGWEHEDKKIVDIAQKETVRHEIIHAFLIESGLADGSLDCKAGWATNEEMIDWIALQFPKISKAMLDANTL